MNYRMDQFTYTRAQAIKDGILIDVTTQAKQVGILGTTVVSDYLYNRYVVPPTGLDGEGQSAQERLQDLLFRTLIATSTSANSDRIEYPVLFLMGPETWVKIRVATVTGPGDQGEPVRTIMLPRMCNVLDIL